MATLSFSCPKCSKLHSRIKPEMVGHKVKCQCGFVFRLGEKKDKLPGVTEDLKRKRAIKARKAATRSKRQNSVPAKPIVPTSSLESPLSEKILEPVVMDREILEPVELNDEILEPVELSDGILEPIELDEILEPIETPSEILEPVEVDEAILEPLELDETLEPVDLEAALLRPGDLMPASGESFLEPILDAIPIASSAPMGQLVAQDPFADPFAQSSQSPIAPGMSPAAGTPTRTPKKKKRKLRSGEIRLQSNTGPIISLIVNFFALLAMTLLTSIFLYGFIRSFGIDDFAAPQASSRKLLSLLTGGLMLVASLLLTISIFASGVTAIMELIQQRLIVWAHKTSAILATLFMFLLFVMMSIGIVGLMMALGKAEELSGNSGRVQAAVGTAITTLIFSSIAMGIAPLAVAITGFVRGRR